MELVKVKGFVLKSIDYKERDRIITLLTPDFGKISVQAKGVNKITSKLTGATNVHSFGEYELNEKDGRYTLVGYENIENFSNISLDIDKHYIAEIMLELTDFSGEEYNVDQIYFINLIKYFKELSYGSGNKKVLLLNFLYYYINSNGVELNFDLKCLRCKCSIKHAKFSYKSLAFICDKCLKTDDAFIEFTTDATQVAKRIFGSDLDDNDFAIKEETFVFLMRNIYVVMQNYLHFKSKSIVEYMKICK